MKHSDFKLGGTFRSGDKLWRCTDVGARTIVAIRIDQIQTTTLVKTRRTLSQAEAEKNGWFNGPPYAVAEHVFDEDDIEACAN